MHRSDVRMQVQFFMAFQSKKIVLYFNIEFQAKSLIGVQTNTKTITI